MATEKQIAANRRNALQSTGPSSLRSKAFTRLNAFRHGLYSAAAIPRDASLKELAQIRGAYMRSCRPQTAAQVRLVEQMATAEWLCSYWDATETRALAEAAGDWARQISLMDRFTARQARYQRAFLKAYDEYERVRDAAL